MRAAAWTYLDVHAASIPLELRALPAVLWRAEPRPGEKPAKVPYRISDPERRASSTNPATWGTFADASEAYAALVTLPPDPCRGLVAGIGVVLTAEARVVCVDLDRVLIDGRLDPRAQQLVTRFDSWTEISPSGTGLHIFGSGRLARAIKGDQIEVYGDARFIAVTGRRWPGTPDHLRDVQACLDRLVALEPAPQRGTWTGAPVPPPDDLAGALLAKLGAWGLRAGPIKRWQDGYLVELPACPWASEHTTGTGGAAVLIRASGAYDFVCLHSHCGARTWRDFRGVMDAAR